MQKLIKLMALASMILSNIAPAQIVFAVDQEISSNENETSEAIAEPDRSIMENNNNEIEDQSVIEQNSLELNTISNEEESEFVEDINLTKINPIVIHTSSITVTTKELAINDVLKIGLAVSYKYNYGDILVTYEMPQSKDTIDFHLEWNAETELFETSTTIDGSYENGTYGLIQITAVDSSGHSESIYNDEETLDSSRESIDLTAGDFIVFETKIKQVDEQVIGDTETKIEEVIESKNAILNEEKEMSQFIETLEPTDNLFNDPYFDDVPLIHYETIAFDKETATMNEEVKIRVKITSEIEISSTTASIVSPLGYLITVNISPVGDDYFEGTYYIREYFEEGPWVMKSIQALDTEGNDIVLSKGYFYKNGRSTYNHTINFEKFVFEVKDTLVPKINIDSINISKVLSITDFNDVSFEVENTKHMFGLTLEFTGPARENSTLRATEYIRYFNRDGNLFTPRYSENGKLADWQIGEWELSKISYTIRDSANNVSEHIDIYDTDFASGPQYRGEFVKDLSNGDFTLQEVVSAIPRFNTSSIKYTNSIVELGDTINVSVEPDKAVENQNNQEPPFINIHYKNDSQIKNVSLNYNSVQKAYVGELDIDHSWNMGEWDIGYIRQSVTENNTTHYEYVYSSDFYKDGAVDFSNYKLTVNERTDPLIDLQFQVVNKDAWVPVTIFKHDLNKTYPSNDESINSIKLSVQNTDASTIEYSVYTKNKQWSSWMNDGTEFSISSGDKIEGFKARLIGESVEYDLAYQFGFSGTMYSSNDFFYTGWGLNGEAIGYLGSSKNLTEIKVALIPKGQTLPYSGNIKFYNPNMEINYTTHVQSYGWKDYVTSGQLSGTTGEAKRLEAIKIKSPDESISGDIEYRTHVEKYGWMDWKKNDELSGTEGESKRLEAIQIRLNGELEEQYDVLYRVHAEKYGWLGWAQNGAEAGTAGFAYRLEAIEIKLIPKGTYFNEEKLPFYELVNDPFINYQTHVQSLGWQYPSYDGETSGTIGEAKRLEGIKINVYNPYIFENGGIEYQTHVEKYGWMPNVNNGELSGTAGEAKRLEAIKIKLTGEVANHFDVYYRVHVEKLGWLDWAKNGESSGTSGFAYRLEGIEIQLVRKNKVAPGETKNAYVSKQ